jgi:hypothetical protein
MRLQLDLDLCSKLLEVFKTHTSDYCTDELRYQQYGDPAGWVPCTRCWLLQTVEDQYIPEIEFELYSSIKVKRMCAEELITIFTNMLNTFGSDDPRCDEFFETHQDNIEFAQLAMVARRVARNLKGFGHE